ncbi:MAG: response regulator [Deltaproteobacteria bacterium]|nr:response regulator [Deltaproteobacteria bacterium]
MNTITPELHSLIQLVASGGSPAAAMAELRITALPADGAFEALRNLQGKAPGYLPETRELLAAFQETLTAMGTPAPEVAGLLAQIAARLDAITAHRASHHPLFPPSTAAEAPTPVGKKAIHLNEACVIIVDDDAVLSRAVMRKLTRSGFSPERIKSFLSVDEALAYLAEGHRVDLVITDYNMPDKDGLVLYREIRHCFPTLPVVMASGNAGDAQRKLTPEEAADLQIFEKPGYLSGVEYSDFLAHLKHLLGHDS